jgi:hypothetical protein
LIPQPYRCVLGGDWLPGNVVGAVGDRSLGVGESLAHGVDIIPSIRLSAQSVLTPPPARPVEGHPVSNKTPSMFFRLPSATKHSTNEK